MPSLTCFQAALVCNKAAKVDFLKSSKCEECIAALSGPGEKGKALALLALAAREPEANTQLRDIINVEVLESCLSANRTSVLRLMAALGHKPSPETVEVIYNVMCLDCPSNDDIAAAQFGARIIKENKIAIDFPYNLKAPYLYVAAQIAATDESTVDQEALWVCMKSPHKQLRLAAARKLVPTKHKDVLRLIVEYIPDLEACDICAEIAALDETNATQLAQHASFKRLLKDPSAVTPEVLRLCAAIGQTDELRLSLMNQGAIKAILAIRSEEALELLRALTRSVRCLRSGSATKEVGQLLIECMEDPQRRPTAMAVACNMIHDTSPISGFILECALKCAFSGLESFEYKLRLNSVWFLKNSTFTNATPEFKARLMEGVGVSRLLKLSDCGDNKIENTALGFLRNYVAYNPSGVDLWLSMCPVDFWSLVERKLRSPHTVVSAMYVLVHVAASNPEHQQAILERPSLLRKVASVLDAAKDEEVLIAGVWFLTNLYQKGSQHDLTMFKHALKKSMRYHVTVRAKAEDLIQLAGES